MIALGLYFVLKETESSNIKEYEEMKHNINQFSEDTVDKLAFLPITATLVFTASFSIGFGPLPWVMNSELFPREAKALASSIGKTQECLIQLMYVNLYCRSYV